jgi:2-iminobutanoate/2-iminopropanoate deaminase
MTPIKEVKPATLAAIGPYSPATICGNMVFVSGQIPKDASGKIVGDTIEAATQVCLDNLHTVLVAAGCTPKNVVKTTVFMQDLGDFEGMNKTYAAFFGDHRPARATVQVAKLPAGSRVEIDCIAML